MLMSLSSEQKYVIKELIKLKKPIQTLGGYAGTGKTVVVKHLNEKLKNFAVCAFTGKAVDVLKKKDVDDASTIHSLIYEPFYDETNDEVIFGLKPYLDYKGIIIDEASMVSEDLFNDLKSFNLPIICVGDHGQLEPVGQNINLMQNPDYTLETIHRNAGEIAHFAEFIRKGNKPINFKSQNPKNIEFVSSKDVMKLYKDVDQIICAYNATRNNVNLSIREKEGKPLDRFVVGDEIMCLRNNKVLGLFNGMQGVVKKIKGRNKILFQSGDFECWCFYDPSQIGLEKYNFSFNRDDPEPFEFRNAITCHKAQGSEWDSVMVIEQMCKHWDHAKWCYTGASRAKEKLKWAIK